jgi:hypothetical protein
MPIAARADPKALARVGFLLSMSGS